MPELKDPIGYTEDGVPILGFMENGSPILAHKPKHEDDAHPVTHQKVTEELKQATADAREIAKELKDGVEADTGLRDAVKDSGEKLEKLDKVVKALQEASRKAPLVIPNENLNPYGMSWDRLMGRRSNQPEIVEAQKLMNRAIVRATIRATRRGVQLTYIVDGEDAEGKASDSAKGEENRSLDISSIPKEYFYEGNPEFEDHLAIRSLAAGDWWDTSTTSGGTEWRPTAIGNVAVDFFTLDTNFVEFFEQQLIPMNVGAFSIPIETTQGQADLEAEVTTAATSFLTTGIFRQEQTGVITFDPHKISRGSGVSTEGNEDLAVDAVSRLQANCANAVRRGLRQCVISGQTASDATLDDAPGTSNIITADGWVDTAGDGNGLRLHCVENTYTTAIGGGIVHSDIVAARKSMGKFGNNPTELMILTDAVGHIGMLDDARVETVDKLGPNATILRGMLASVGGIPLFADSEMPSTMDAAGINAGTGALSGALIVNRRRFWVATKRQLQMTLLPQPGVDVINVIARMRADSKIAISGIGGAGEHSAHYLVNVS